VTAPGSPYRLLVIIGSTRPGRIGLPVATWFVERAQKHGGFEVEVADLAEINLPFLDEPHHPRLRQYTKEHTLRWSATVERADAVVFVVPEYNYGMSAPVKNAVDFLNHEWHHKAAGFVSYGGVAAGTRGAQMLKQVITTLRMFPVVEAVSIPFVFQFLVDGVINANQTMEESAIAMLDEMARVTPALKQLRPN
jgi:NAD(P)H-dependent FMN reductase